MFNNLKQNVPAIQIFVAYILYIVILVCASFPVSIFWIIVNIYLWLLLSIVLRTYTLRSFIYILCISGIVVSISLFFIQGVEELPFPKGALMFNLHNVLKSFVLFFVCTIPLIIMGSSSSQESPRLNYKAQQKKEKEEDVWEEATIEDLQSGNYEAL